MASSSALVGAAAVVGDCATVVQGNPWAGGREWSEVAIVGQWAPPSWRAPQGSMRVADVVGAESRDGEPPSRGGGGRGAARAESFGRWRREIRDGCGWVAGHETWDLGFCVTSGPCKKIRCELNPQSASESNSSIPTDQKTQIS